MPDQMTEAEISSALTNLRLDFNHSEGCECVACRALAAAHQLLDQRDAANTLLLGMSQRATDLEGMLEVANKERDKLADKLADSVHAHARTEKERADALNAARVTANDNRKLSQALNASNLRAEGAITNRDQALEVLTKSEQARDELRNTVKAVLDNDDTYMPQELRLRLIAAVCPTQAGGVLPSGPTTTTIGDDGPEVVKPIDEEGS